uniref:Uncharacterized protein n=2 Tax=Lotharella globosa TaxID=91324 RepID=A0A7S3YL45_9EUKA
MRALAHGNVAGFVKHERKANALERRSHHMPGLHRGRGRWHRGRGRRFVRPSGVALAAITVGASPPKRPVVINKTTVIVKEQPKNNASPGFPLVLQATVPPNVRAGQSFQVQANGQLVNVQVPQGMGPGAVIQFKAPSPPLPTKAPPPCSVGPTGTCRKAAGALRRHHPSGNGCGAEASGQHQRSSHGGK